MPDTDLDAQVSWVASDPSDKVIPAFVKALWEMEDVVKEHSVSAGPMRYSYADLAAVLGEVRPKLRAHGLALSQTPTVDHGVTTTLFHESGQWIRFAPLKLTPAGATPQHVGSAITYARRYSALAVNGLATEDDDGRSASVATEPPAENPLAPRVDEAMHRMSALSTGAKAKMRAWADGEGRRLSGNALFGDAEWLSEVEAWLDVNENDDEADDGPDEEPF